MSMYIFENHKRGPCDVWTRAWRHFNAALNERAPSRQMTAWRARRRSLWSSCTHNEWKDRKTTQQHGQIRLSETIFKIWVRVQAVTSLSLWLRSPSSVPDSTFVPRLSLCFLPLLVESLHPLSTSTSLCISFSVSTYSARAIQAGRLLVLSYMASLDYTKFIVNSWQWTMHLNTIMPKI